MASSDVLVSLFKVCPKYSLQLTIQLPIQDNIFDKNFEILHVGKIFGNKSTKKYRQTDDNKSPLLNIFI